MATFARVYEEASPLRSNGTEYDQYRLHVPAWLPRWQAWILIEAVPETFFVTPHYKSWPLVLVRPEKLDLVWAKANLIRVWRAQAPKRVLKAYDEAQQRKR